MNTPTDPAAPPAPFSGGISLRIVNYNTMLLTQFITLQGDDFRNQERVTKILAAQFLKDNDIVVLEELFNIAPSVALLNGLHDLGYTHQTRVVGATVWHDQKSFVPWDAQHHTSTGTEPENGGVAVVSRYPITRAEEFVYRDGCGADHEAAKGFAYVRVDKAGRSFHLVATHTQSTDTGCGGPEDYRAKSAAIRLRQFTQMDAFLTDLEHSGRIPSGEPLILTGDFNVDRHDTTEYPGVLDTLRARAGTHSGPDCSFDTAHNTLARLRYPGDPAEDLDHALQRTGHPPLDDWAVTVVTPATTSYTVTHDHHDTTVTDLSDHYPITATGTLATPALPPATLTVDKVLMTKGDDANGDDLYGEITVNGHRAWYRDRSHPLDNHKPPYELPDLDHTPHPGWDQRFTITALIMDDDFPDDPDELVRHTFTLDATTPPGQQTIPVTGPRGAAELTYTLRR
ncbi:sphingomyelin phosphodiesterase [Streptomyces sp. NPDC017979]|uniref:sphingomyelin phosphodiesterase n=1 Tax=Streptomyces sp. NPDC017979 TaxID=3365024 RepID=UPI00378E7EAF